MRRHIGLFILPWMLVAVSAAGAPTPWEIIDADQGLATFPTTAADPVCLYYEDFQNGPAGWVAKDVTRYPTGGVAWHQTTYEDHTGTHGVMWCGTDAYATPGYGNNWEQYLTKSFVLPLSYDADSLAYSMQWSVEPGFDFVHVEFSWDGGPFFLEMMVDGTLGFSRHGRILSGGFGQVLTIRFKFVSDGGYSDEDGLFDSNGACRIDWVKVPGYPRDSFTTGNDGWVASIPEWHVVDGGFRLVPEPVCFPAPAPPCDMYCNAWVAYDPVTGVFPFSHGLPPYDKTPLRLAIESPVIQIPAGATSYLVTFDVFRHLPLDNAVFYNIEVAAPAPENGGTFKGLYSMITGTTGHLRYSRNITSLIQPGATTMKVRLAGVDMVGLGLGGSGAQHTPAPFFDNVSISAFGTADPGVDCSGFPRFCNYGYTQPGTDVLVNPLDPTSGTRPVTLEFDAVVGSGSTTVTTSGTGPPPPSGFRLGSPPIYYEVQSTATYTGLIEVCIDYSGVSFGNESNLRLLHQENGPWVDRTSSLDTQANRICGLVSSLSPFLVCEQVLEGDLTGTVLAPCPNPATPLLGVTVDAFEMGTGVLVGSAVTDASGAWFIADLPAGQYTVTLVTPLGYSAAAEEVGATIAGGDVVTVDFALSCLSVTPDPRSMGFWKHQVGVATTGRGSAQVDAATLCQYLDLIEAHFNNNGLNPIVVYQPPASGLCADKLEAAKGLLNLSGSAAMSARAKQHFMALLLNIAGGRLDLRTAISADGATVSQAITYCDQLLRDGDPATDESAKNIADWINNAIQVPAGTIPLSTPDIAYARGRGGRGLPLALVLEQNHPNPFNPMTTIRFALPRSGDVRLAVFDVAGRLVRTLVRDHGVAGRHELHWDGTTDAGVRVAAGTYWLRLEANGEARSARMVVLK